MQDEHQISNQSKNSFQATNMAKKMAKKKATLFFETQLQNLSRRSQQQSKTHRDENIYSRKKYIYIYRERLQRLEKQQFQQYVVGLFFFVRVFF
jgi:hypothetical protein